MVLHRTLGCICIVLHFHTMLITIGSQLWWSCDLDVYLRCYNVHHNFLCFQNKIWRR